MFDGAVNENVGFDGASPAVGPDTSFVPDVEGWPNADEALPAVALNENVGLDVAADDAEGENENVDFEGAVAVAAGVDTLSFFPNEKVDVEPNVPNAGLPNEDEIFGLDVEFPNGPAGAGPDPVAGEPAGVVENRLVGVPKADVVLGVARPLLVSPLVVESGCLPKAPVEVEFPNAEPLKADAVAPKGAGDGLAVVASFLVSPVTVVGFETTAVVGVPKVNLGLVSVVAEAPVDGCANENLVKVDAGCVAELVVAVEGKAGKEGTDAGGFGSDDAVTGEVVLGVNAVVIGVVIELVTGTAGEEALVDECPTVVGFANEKVEALGASAVDCVVPQEDGWVWLATGSVKGKVVAAAGVADGAGDVEGFAKKFGIEAEAEGVVVAVAGAVGRVKENAGAVVAGWGAPEEVEGIEEVDGRVNPGAALDIGKLVAGFGVTTGTGVKENGDGTLVSVDVTLLSTFASTGEGDAGVSVIVGTVKVFAPN